MPQYCYKHPKKTQFIELTQKMNDVHEYIDEEGTKWERVWTKPRFSVDTNIDPLSSKDFAAKTNKKGSYGDLIDRAEELSQIRKDKYGVDPVKEQYYDSWSKKRGGKKVHPEKSKEAARAACEKAGIELTDD